MEINFLSKHTYIFTAVLFHFFQINSANDASKHGGLQAQPAPSAIDLYVPETEAQINAIVKDRIFRQNTMLNLFFFSD